MGDVVRLHQITRLDQHPDRILSEMPSDLESVVLLGWKQNGDFYFASSIASGPKIVWLLELAKKKLLEIGENGSDA